MTESQDAWSDQTQPVWTPPESTGVAGVDDAVASLAGLDALPIAEHVQVYDQVHRQLQDALADLDGH